MKTFDTNNNNTVNENAKICANCKYFIYVRVWVCGNENTGIIHTDRNSYCDEFERKIK